MTYPQYPQYCMLVTYHHDVGVYRALCECIDLFGICVYILCIFKLKCTTAVYTGISIRYHTVQVCFAYVGVCVCLSVCLSVFCGSFV